MALKYGKAKSNECFSVITISFNKMEVIKYSYSPKYESVSLFSYVGGYLGLWLGISLVAICDVIETAVLIIEWSVLTIRKCRKRKLETKPQIKLMRNSGRAWLL
ncbi:uncharacterized protein LOC118195285 [Stegodyphus dumicola]|uniref:uncharacterized protein LOC118195285 n=1 Tax=Stegodyphus dumicola TaxID=202533 RepID=UPI0015AFA097|nr:uncharacterized protein LOC118195285 [Stegodyphus dumicola]